MQSRSSMAKKPAITPPEVCSTPVFHSSTTMGKPHSISAVAAKRCPRMPTPRDTPRAQLTRSRTGRPSWNSRIRKAASREKGSTKIPLPISPRTRSTSGEIRKAWTPKRPSSSSAARNRHTKAQTSRRMGRTADLAPARPRAVDFPVERPPPVVFLRSAMEKKLLFYFTRERIKVTRPMPQQ